MAAMLRFILASVLIASCRQAPSAPPPLSADAAGQVVKVAGRVEVVRGGARAALTAGAAVLPGDRLEVDGAVDLSQRDGHLIQLGGGSEAVVPGRATSGDGDARILALFLDKGAATVVAAGEALVDTPHAQITVDGGARVTVSADGYATRVFVSAGGATLFRLADRTRQRIGPRAQAMARATVEPAFLK